MKKSFSALGVFALSAAVLAQAILGSTTDVRGLVTVSDATSVATVVDNMPIIDGTRFVTSSSGFVTLKLKDNCDVTLRPNQSIVIDQNLNCPELFAMIQSLGGPAVAGIGSDPVMQAIAGIAILALVGGKNGTQPSNPANPLLPGDTPTYPGGETGQIPDLPISPQ